MFRSALLLTGICLVGCQTIGGQSAHPGTAEFRLENVDPECDAKLWPDIKGPQTQNNLPHNWYLDQIKAIYPGMAAVCDARKEWLFFDHDERLSWGKVQLVYWLARRNLGIEVEHWLMPLNSEQGWTSYTPPGPELPDPTVTAKTLLEEALQAILANDPLRAKIDEQLAAKGTNVVEMFGHRLTNFYTGHNCEAAWMHAWNAWCWAKKGDATDQAVHWIICEIEHDI